MKRKSVIVALLLVLLVAGTSCNHIRHDGRNMRDSEKMIRMRMGNNFRHDGLKPGMSGMMDHGMRFGMMRGMDRGRGFGMMRGMRRMPMDSTGWMPMGPGRRILESIPNVTENQKKLITDLIKKRQDEMKKLREEMSSKMQSLMESNKNDMLNILTDEQKKFIESERGNSSAVPEKAK